MENDSLHKSMKGNCSVAFNYYYY